MGPGRKVNERLGPGENCVIAEGGPQVLGYKEEPPKIAN